MPTEIEPPMAEPRHRHVMAATETAIGRVLYTFLSAYGRLAPSVLRRFILQSQVFQFRSQSQVFPFRSLETPSRAAK